MFCTCMANLFRLLVSLCLLAMMASPHVLPDAPASGQAASGHDAPASGQAALGPAAVGQVEAAQAVAKEEDRNRDDEQRREKSLLRFIPYRGIYLI